MGDTTDDLRLAEAEFRVWRHDRAIADLVAEAVALMVAGTDTPNLRILAGEDGADADEVDGVLKGALRDLGLEPLDRRAAVLLIARYLATRAIDDFGAAAEVAPILWRLYASEPMNVDWPPEFGRLAVAADRVVDLPELDGSMPEFMAAARAFVVSPD